VIQDELVTQIVKAEFEAYTIKDHEVMIPLLKKYNDSILFINIDSGLKEPDWEIYIRSIMENPETSNVKIGILTYYEDKELAEKYLMDLMVPCGFILLKIGLLESTKIILKALLANEAKGDRKYIRARCNNNMATLNLMVGEKLVKGEILDISSVGLACTLNGISCDELPRDTVVTDVQMRLKGQLTMISGTVQGCRSGSEPVFIILFAKMEPVIKEKIHSFIHKHLQYQIDEEIKKLQ
jgi:hypothetical protein